VFSTSDTIVAIATPPGRGGIGVVRLSGPDARAIAEDLIAWRRPLEPRRAVFTIVRVRAAANRGRAARGDGRLVVSGATERTVPAPGAVAAPDVGSEGTVDLDQVVVTYFRRPRSYTGEDVVELSAHGSPVVLRAIVDAAVSRGARVAAPGEFTLRAFLNGRIELAQAEAVADLVDAVTPLQARAAFDQLQGTLTNAIAEIDRSLFDLAARLEASIDFPEEGYHFVEPGDVERALGELCDRLAQLLDEGSRGRMIREGLQIAIIGKPNVGKSSLFNALAGTARAIVTDVPGTTRDLVTETVDLDGLQVLLVDTAGLRATSDAVEAEGVTRARRAFGVADLTLVVLDSSRPIDRDDRDIISQTINNKRLIVVNKADVDAVWREPSLGGISVSAGTGFGLAALRRRIAEAMTAGSDLTERPTITNVRHLALVGRAHDALSRARSAVRAAGGALSEEFVLADLQEARTALEEIGGRRTSDDLLAHVFSRFCVGK
jgi:tRNA modification GTPase